MILTKTDAGMRVLKDRSVPLTARQRAAFILVDGRKTVEELLAATRAAGVTREDVERLMELGLVQKPTFAQAAVNAAKLEAKRTARSLEDRYEEAWPIASMLTSNLGLRGYRLNVAVEQATNYMDLLAIAPRIREAVGEERYIPLDRALND
jgi:hypothetical protein